jgi:drug/metabolite transporter (DMT)-like permease
MNSRATLPAILLALLGVYVIWGSTYLGIRFALESFPPFLLAGARFLAAGAILVGWAVWRGARRPTALHLRNAAVVGACLILGGNGGVTVAEQYIPSGLTALLIAATAPLFMTLFAWFGRVSPRPPTLVWFALALGLVGTYLVARPDARVSTASTPLWYFGLGVVILGSLAWSFGSLFSRDAAHPDSMILTIGIQMLAGGLMELIVGLLLGEPGHFLPITPKAIWAWVYLVAVGAVVGYSAYIWLLSVASPTLVGTYAFVNPVIAVILGTTLAGETIDLRTVIGTIVIAIAVAIILWQTSRRPAAQKHPIEPTDSVTIPVTD